MRQLDIGKISTFLLITVVLSLTQVWALAVILWGTGKPVDMKTLLGDGGVFFFSLTIVAVSAFDLADKGGALKKGSIDLNITALAVCLCCMPAVLLYASITSRNLSQATPTAGPFADRWPVQVVCAMMAIAYAFYSEMRTGSLTKVP